MADQNSPSALLPKRNPGLIEKIARRFNLIQPDLGPQPELRNSTETGRADSDVETNSWDEYLKGSLTRKQLYRDVEEMDRSSEEISRALNTIASNALQSEDGSQESFEVHAKSEAAQKSIDGVITRIGLHEAIRPIGRGLVKYGDSFNEIVIAGTSQLAVTALRQLKPATMHRNEDTSGRLKLGKPNFRVDDKTGAMVPSNKRGECAYDQVAGQDEKLVASFRPFQIIHGRLNWDGFDKYGKSHLATTRSIWKKLKQLEEGLVIGRLTRDLMKLVFYVDTTGLSKREKRAAVQEFKDSITQRQKIDGRRENPYSIMTDFYVSSGYVRVGAEVRPTTTKVDVIDPKNEGIQHIQDIEYFHRKLLITLMVPPSHMGFGSEQSGNGVVGAQDVQYVRWLKSYVQAELSCMLKQLFDMQLILDGINPLDPANAYDICWPALRATDEGAAAQAFLAYAQGDQIYMQEGVIDTTYLMRHRYGMDDEEVAEMQAFVDQEEQDELDRLAQEAEIGVKVQTSVTGVGAVPGGKGPVGVGPTAAKGANKGPKDTDGKRKGDEARSASGKRIAPSKSKPKGTPPGSGSRTRKVNAGLHPSNWVLLEALATAA
jgi:hypothetical protein